MRTLKFKGKAAEAIVAALSAAPQYLILYRQHASGYALWWRPNSSGYTVDVAEAGRYSKEEAEAIAGLRGDDLPVPLADIGKRLKVRQVVSHDDGDNHVMLKTYSRSETPGEPK
jgi:hypothetical protein